MRSWFRRVSRTRPATTYRSRNYRPRLEGFEDRLVPAAPVINDIAVPLDVPTSNVLMVPITGTDADGDAITYTVQASNGVQVTQRTGDTYVRMAISIGGQAAGELVFKLFDDITPNTTAIIAGLVQSEFYDGLTFHRIADLGGGAFIVQGGDPLGTGQGGPPKGGTTEQREAFQFPDEFHPQALFTGTGQLAMANSGDDTNGSQFFITASRPGMPRHLDFNHTIFGQLVKGFDLLERIRSIPTTNSTPSQTVTMTSVDVVRDTTSTVVTLQAPANPGPYTLTVTATDSKGESTTRTFASGQVYTDPVPNSPAFLNGPVPDLTTPVVANDGAPVNVTLTGTDPEGDALTFEIVVANVPNNNHANDIDITNNGGGSFTLDPKPGFTGRIILEARAKDATHPADTQRFVLAVGDQPVTATGTTVSGVEGAALPADTVVASFTDADAAGMAVDFVASINWGDGSANTNATVVARAGGGFEVRGGHTYAEAGVYQIRVEINGLAGGTAASPEGVRARVTSTATIADAPLSGQGVQIGTTAGVPLTNVAVATFTDASPNAVAGDYTVTINWGDGAITPGTVVRNTVEDRFEVFGSHTYAAAGNFTITTTITDADTSAKVLASTATVTAPAGIAPPPPPPPFHQQFADSLWMDFFGTPADAPTRATVESLLAGMAPYDVVLTIYNSIDFKRDQVNQLYQQLLDRPADPLGKELGAQFLVQGGDIEELISIIIGSDEYQENHGDTTEGVLNALYEDILGREIEEEAEEFWADEVRSGDTIQEIALRVLRSPEGAFRRMQIFYQTHLGRSASQDEVNELLRQDAFGTSDALIVAGIAASSENLAQLL